MGSEGYSQAIGTVEFHDDVDFGLAATLLLRISHDQTIAIHNIHNQLKKVEIPDLLQEVTATGQDFLVGDSNLHHAIWGGEKVTVIEPQAVELANGMSKVSMGLLTTRGFTTCSLRQCFAGEYSSTIDLTYANSSLVPFVRKWESPDVPGFDSGHRVVMTTLNLDINRVASTYYLWKLADPKKFYYFVTIHNQCLKIVTGALGRTAMQTLPQETCIEDILVFLERVTTVQRARALDTPDHKRLRRVRRHGKKPTEPGGPEASVAS
ncbi:hypothetical protein QWA68_005609 [Fusarium oxysporum]|nr:hypothetical protein QWA68_005609 [Fusarium oxysporum]